VIKLICGAGSSRPDIRIDIFLDSSNFEKVDGVIVPLKSAKTVTKCADNISVHSRGKSPFGTSGAHLQHMKVFLASPQSELIPLSVLFKRGDRDEVKRLSETRTVVTTASANLSSSGTSLHFENWLFFEDDTSSHMIQANICSLWALRKARGENGRPVFAAELNSCLTDIYSKERRDLKFFAVPHGRKNPRPYLALKRELDKANSEIMVAIHRLTTNSIGSLLSSAAKRNVNVRVVYDDDTLIASNPDADVDREKIRASGQDVKIYRSITRAGVKSRFMETNHEIVHLHHNKFMVIDGKVLFQGAGNFTGTALNVGNRPGNYEQFYLIKIPEIAEAYQAAWYRLYRLATPARDHKYGRR